MIWTRAKGCETNACAEVTTDGECVLIRNSSDPLVRILFSREEWETFVAGAKDGDFDFNTL